MGAAPRILFVDDEDGARRLFTRIAKPEGYHVILAADGVEALAILASQKVDVLVTDLHMPRLGGFELLKLVRKEHPALPCVLTSGMADSADIIRAFKTGLAVFLSKPYRPSQLVEAIASVLGKTSGPPGSRAPDAEVTTGSRGPDAEVTTGGAPANDGRDLTKMGRQIMASFRSGKSKLPDPHPLTQELHKLQENPDLGAAAVDQMIQASPLLSVKAMMMANSAYYGASRPVSNVKDAVRRLGNRRVLDLVQTIIQRSLYSTRSAVFGSLLTESWTQTVFESNLARELVKGRTASAPEDVYLAVLMHNLGEALMLRILAKEWDGRPVTPSDIELIGQIVQRHHEELGKLALTAWKFPNACIRIAGNHHDIYGRNGTPRPTREDAAVIHILNICAHASQDRWIRSSVSAIPKLDLQDSMNAARLNPDDLDVAVTQAVLLSKAFLAETTAQAG